MTSTTEWRKLADAAQHADSDNFAVTAFQAGEALRAACDAIDELEKEGSALDWRDACDLALVAASDRIDELEKEGSALDWRDACDLANKRAEAAGARCRELEAENKRLHDFHYERTKLTDMHIKRAGAAEARVAELEAESNQKSRDWVAAVAIGAELKARLAVAVEGLQEVLKEGERWDMSMVAWIARAALAKLRGEP